MFILGTGLKKRNGQVFTQDAYTTSYYFIDGGGAPEDAGSEESVRAQMYRYFEGYDQPNYHARLRKGELMPFTPWKRYAFQAYPVCGVYDYWVNDYRHFICVPENQWYPKSGWLITEAYLRGLAEDNYSYLVTNAAARVYGRGFDALTWLAELKDVKRLWESIAKKLSNIKNLKRLPLGKGLKQLRALNPKTYASNWLEYRYGWSQFVRDYKNLSDAIETLKAAKGRVSERAGLRQSFQRNTTENQTWAYLDVLISTTDECLVQARGSVVADIEVPAFQFNPLQTAWEVIPLSFVLDWFVNVGKTLAAISFLINAKQYASSWGFKVTVDRTWRLLAVGGHNGYTGGHVEQWMHCVGELETRVPCPVPYFPHHAVSLNYTKVTDLLSLITQRLK